VSERRLFGPGATQPTLPESRRPIFPQFYARPAGLFASQFQISLSQVPSNKRRCQELFPYKGLHRGRFDRTTRVRYNDRPTNSQSAQNPTTGFGRCRNEASIGLQRGSPHYLHERTLERRALEGRGLLTAIAGEWLAAFGIFAINTGQPVENIIVA